MKYVCYVSSALMIIISFVPYILISGAAGHSRTPDFEVIIVNSILSGNGGFLFQAFLLPIVAIFLSTALILWIHKRDG